MQIKPPEILNRLPSVAELLEKPPIRALADRWNRTVVAGRVQTFLDELRSDFERRTATLPSIRELAERAARYVMSRQHDHLGVAINATGNVCGSAWVATPLSEAALEQMMALGREFAFEPSSSTTRGQVRLETVLRRLTGAQAAAVLHSYDAAVGLARERGLTSIVELGSAPLVNPPETMAFPWKSAEASIAGGAEMIILRGDGLVGGPPCGILLGQQSALSRVAGHSLFESLLLDPLRLAALSATVDCYASPSRGCDDLPVWQLLSTSIDNLKNRAERLASQLAHADGITAANAVETQSPISPELDGSAWPSCGVALAPSDGNATALDHRLRTGRFPIVGRVEDSRVVLDLRTVLPRQDKQITDTLLGDTPKPATS